MSAEVAMELDHIFLRSRPDAPEAQSLTSFGLTEGSANTHPGQGTANRRFFFGNAFIELLWLANAEEADSEQTRPTRLAERLQPSPDGASPFGICFRPSGRNAAVPFETWRYTPGYLPKGMAIRIAGDAPLEEPMWFFLAGAMSPDAVPAERRQPLVHTAGLRRITSIRVTVPGEGSWSEAARAAMATNILILVRGEAHLLELGFDDEASGQVRDFRPELPLVFRF